MWVAGDCMVGSRWLIALAAISGCICVGIGALGSHSLPKRLQQAGLSDSQIQSKINQCEIAVKYQMYHSLAALGLGLCPATARRRSWRIASGFFFAGILCFSGGLYSLVYFDAMGHWSIVPLGGLSFMIGWLAIVSGAFFGINLSQSTGNSVA